MILYQLKCANGDEFEAWFLDSATFDQQRAAGDVECPFCGDSRVSKAPMAPNLAKRGSSEATEERAREVARKILRAVGDLREHVEETCDNVGDRFAEEARRIHYGEADERGIYGEATGEEASELDEEGIEFYHVPWGPRRND